jgi:hypothetical protein
MAKFSTAALKRAVAADAKRKAAFPTMLRPETQHPKLQRAEREAEGLLADFYREAGLNSRAFSRLRKEHSAELARALEAEKAAAVKRASRVKGTVHSSIIGQAQALQQMTVGNGFFPYPSYSLDKPILIWAAPHANILSDSNIESFNSWAKIRVRTGADQGAEAVSFYFLWSNPSPYFAVINAATFMSATGHLTAVATGGLSGIDPRSRHSDVGVSANLALWQWWTSPQTHTPYTSYPLGEVHASASFWDKSRTADVSRGAQLTQSTLLVPPHATVIVEVNCTVAYYQGHGHMDADFESGDFRITCPVVLISVLTPPNAGAVMSSAT